ncbi:hypothetical protein GK091_24270 [Spirosoma agri]|uniref:Uncharacterized protein n=1 Tax=Spirosoma agri TaxID=1987381 RepID=A0A6M0INX2_9BACT|nr:hypothetical protein [Spirosoma agri]NEU70019.1 hypothetical protein [Spirosoma agri]
MHAAHEAECPAAVPLIGTVLWRTGERLAKVYGDQAYNGVFAKALAEWSIDRTGDPVRESFTSRIGPRLCACSQALGGRTEHCVD